MKKYIQSALCAIAIIHLYLYSPTRIEGTIGDHVSAIYYTAWEVKRLVQIPAIYAFLILAIQLLWPSGRKKAVVKKSEDHQTEEQETVPPVSRTPA
jgi:hypothetical protein